MGGGFATMGWVFRGKISGLSVFVGREGGLMFGTRTGKFGSTEWQAAGPKLVK